MTKATSIFLFLMLLILFTSCSAKDDCMKIAYVPYLYTVGNNQIKTDFREQEVPCDFPEPESISELPTLENFTYETLYFTFIPDTGHQTSQLKFEIKLNNPNNYDVEGLPVLTILSNNNVEFSASYSDEATIACYGIAANSSCILTFDKEYALNPDIGETETMELISVSYYITN